jgi:hypothetical protein
MQTDNLGNVQLCKPSAGVGSVHRNEVGNLRQLVHYYPYGVVPFLSTRQANNEVHGDLLPFPLGNLQRLQQPCWPLMLCLDTLTSVADSHVLCNWTLHPIPPESFLQVVIHLRAARMDRICCIMSLTQNQLPEILHIRHTYTTLVPQGTLIILSEMRGFTNLKQLTNLLQLLIILLMLPDLRL